MEEKKYVSFYLSAVCIFIFTNMSVAQLGLTRTKSIDSLLSFYDRDQFPGAAVAVVQAGEVLYLAGKGWADIEHHIKINQDTKFYAGSISKQFVATCIAILGERGLLSIDDDIKKYFPRFPDYGHQITISHLIHHTSGIKDYFDLLEGEGINYLDHPSKEFVFQLIFSQDSLNFVPGQEWRYSNSGYILLADIIQIVSGLNLKEFAAKEIFSVLGMSNSFFLDDIDTLVFDRAWGYQIDGKQVKNMFMRFDLVGSGGLYTTVEDLIKWNNNFKKNRLNQSSPSLIQSLYYSPVLADGKNCNYAFALSKAEHLGRKTIGHTGSLGGYRAAYQRYPEEDLSIIILTNASNYQPSETVKSIAELILK